MLEPRGHRSRGLRCQVQTGVKLWRHLCCDWATATGPGSVAELPGAAQVCGSRVSTADQGVLPKVGIGTQGAGRSL